MDALSLSTQGASIEHSADMSQKNLEKNGGGVRVHRIQYRCAEGRSSTTHLNHSTRVTVPSSPAPDQRLTTTTNTTGRRLSVLGAGTFNATSTTVAEKTNTLHASESVNSLSSSGVESTTSGGEMRRLVQYVTSSEKSHQQEQRHIYSKDFSLSTDSETTQTSNSFDASEMTSHSSSNSLVRIGEQNLPTTTTTTTVESELSRQMAILRRSQCSARTVKNVEGRVQHSTTVYSESLIHSMEEECQALEKVLRLVPIGRELADHEGDAAVIKPNAGAGAIGMSDFLKTMDQPPVSFLVDLIKPSAGPTDDASSADESEAFEKGGGGGGAGESGGARSVLIAEKGSSSTKEVEATSAEKGQTIRMRFNAMNRRRNLGSARLFRTIICHSDLDQVISISLPPTENILNPEDEPKSQQNASQHRKHRKDLLRHLVETVVQQSRSAKKDADLSREYIAILENLSKQAEDVCHSVICSGGLESLIYACRSEDPETLKYAVFALANLTIHGGEASQIQLVKQHAVEWLLPIALHNDEHLRYYAFLTLLLLLVNKDLMPTVANSDLLKLFVPFVNSHDPVEFTKESQLDPIIFSPEWMSRLLPALTVGRREAQALAAFHVVAAITAMDNSLQKFCPDTEEQRQLSQTLQELAETENLPTSSLVTQALQLLGIPIPKCLSMQVYRWSVEDVVCWMSRIGFENLVVKVRSLEVNGDLLLTITDSELREDLGLSNSIARRRFLRELVRLKCKADYSAIDATELADFLAAVSEHPANTANHCMCDSSLWDADLTQYTYSLLLVGVIRPCLAKLSDKDLEEACHIENPFHRQQILEAAKNKDLLSTSASEKLDAFISYRRSNGSHLASLLKVHLESRGYHIFLDINSLPAGRFDHCLLNSVSRAINFILILTPHALDRCLNDEECNDWVHKEITCALENKCNIIPVTERFDWPAAEDMPEDIRCITQYNSVNWSHDYQEACMKKLEGFMTAKDSPTPQKTSKCV